MVAPVLGAGATSAAVVLRYYLGSASVVTSGLVMNGASDGVEMRTIGR